MNSSTRLFAEYSVRMTAVLLLGGQFAFAQETASTTPPPVPSEELPAGSQTLASGPVHEAFATPVSSEPQTPLVVPKQPPANLQEVPPSERPAGASVVWVPGYWAWDADRLDFIWVSGCWRNLPPNTYWVPGYWLQADNGWQWIGGFWAPVSTQQQQSIDYLPAPPALTTTEAVAAPPQPDQTWVPGCWYWTQDRYVWRPGYWMNQQEGWVWIPSHYVWTPRGYVFCQGHWDYDLDSRGVLFTPTYFPPDVRVMTGFVYCPSVCVDLGVLRLNLFAYPRYRHYYFGDYYDDSYRVVGIYPWYQCQTINVWYDPIFVYDRWHCRHSEPHWAENRAHDFEVRHSNRDLRPPRNFGDTPSHGGRGNVGDRHFDKPMVQPLKTVVASPNAPVKFERVNDADRQRFATRATESRTLRDQRNHWESTTEPSSGGKPNVVRRTSPDKGKPTPEEKPNAQPVRTASKPIKENPQKTDLPQPQNTVRPVEKPTVQTRPTEVPQAQTPVVRPAAVRPVKEVVPSEKPQTQPSVVNRAIEKPVANVRPVESSQPQPVRVTQPERVAIPSPQRIQGGADSANSAARGVPNRPSGERTRVDPASGKGSSDSDRGDTPNRRR